MSSNPLHHSYNTPISLSKTIQSSEIHSHKNNKVNQKSDCFLVHKYLFYLDAKPVLLVVSPIFFRDKIQVEQYSFCNKENMTHKWQNIVHIGTEQLSAVYLNHIAKINKSFFRMMLKVTDNNFNVTDCGRFHALFNNKDQFLETVQRVKNNSEVPFNYKNYWVIPVSSALGQLIELPPILEIVDSSLQDFKNAKQNWSDRHNPFCQTNLSIFKEFKSGVQFYYGNYFVLKFNIELNQKTLADLVKAIAPFSSKVGKSKNNEEFINWFFNEPFLKSQKHKTLLHLIQNKDILEQIQTNHSEKHEYLILLTKFSDQVNSPPILSTSNKSSSEFFSSIYPLQYYALVFRIPSIKDTPDYNHKNRVARQKDEKLDFFENLQNCRLIPGELYLIPASFLVPTRFEASMYKNYQQGLSMLVNFERSVIVSELAHLMDFNFIPFKHLYCALQNSAADSDYNYQYLETIGDSVLKFVVSLHLFTSNEGDQGVLTSKKVAIIKNDNLANFGIQAGLQFFIRFNKIKNQFFIPPNFELSVQKLTNSEEEINERYKESKASPSEGSWKLKNEREVKKRIMVQHDVSRDVVADCVEALIGAAFTKNFQIANGVAVIQRFKLLTDFDFSNFKKALVCPVLCDSTSLRTAFKLHPKIIHKSSNQYLFNFNLSSIHKLKKRKKKSLNKFSILNKTSLDKNKVFMPWDIHLPCFREPIERDEIESIYQKQFQKKHLFYVFKNQFWFKQAIDLKSTEFQRLEYFGDSVLEIYVISHCFFALHHFCQPVTPLLLSLSKAWLGSCYQLCRFAVHFKLHKMLKNLSSNLKSEITEFLFVYDKHCTVEKDFVTNGVKSPTLEDSFEAMLGAVFMDGSWPAVQQFLDQRFLPYFIYFAKFHEKMTLDAKGDILKHFQSLGKRCEYRDGKKKEFYWFALIIYKQGTSEESEEVYERHTSIEKNVAENECLLKILKRLKLLEDENRK